jgi:hypothetical protein
MLTLNPSFFEEDQWGQFIDIEKHQLFPKQIIQYATTVKTDATTVKTDATSVKTTTTTPPLKSILKKPIEIQLSVQNQNQNSIKEEENEKGKDYRFQEFIERQLYVGWLICALTFGFCLIP